MKYDHIAQCKLAAFKVRERCLKDLESTSLHKVNSIIQLSDANLLSLSGKLNELDRELLIPLNFLLMEQKKGIVDVRDLVGKPWLNAYKNLRYLEPQFVK